MRLAQTIRIGSWILVCLNLLMAVGSIGIFTRMAPAIQVILEHNENSMRAYIEMLAIMAVSGSGSPFSPEQARLFREAFDRAKTVVSEPEEMPILQRLEPVLPSLFRGESIVRKDIVSDIRLLGRINYDAMVKANLRAQQLGRAGTWGVVFMAISVFLAGVVFIRSLTRLIVRPLEEIHSVIIAHRNGETMRRCTGVDLSQDVTAVFTGINEFLDQSQALASGGNRSVEY